MITATGLCSMCLVFLIGYMLTVPNGSCGNGWKHTACLFLSYLVLLAAFTIADHFPHLELLSIVLLIVFALLMNITYNLFIKECFGEKGEHEK